MNQIVLAICDIVEIYAEKSISNTLNEFENQLYEAGSIMLKTYINRIERNLRRRKRKRNENNSCDTE